jgi:hypothetical protein
MRLGVAVDPLSQKAILQAKKWRDPMIHYEFDLFVHEVRDAYSLLFEFCHVFPLKTNWARSCTRTSESIFG